MALITKKIFSEEQFKKVVGDLVEITTPVIIGDAGVGKTVLMEEIAQGYDMSFIKRMTGITDEVIQGIPDKQGDRFSFLKLDFMAEIVNNPDKTIFLGLDEINRTPPQLRPALFELFERKINGVFYPNLHVVCAINYGDNFEVNWDIASDEALLSRIALLEYIPNKADAINKMTNVYGYNDILMRVVDRIDTLLCTTVSHEGEQKTNFRSWKKLNHVFQNNKVGDVKKASEVIEDYANIFFNSVTLVKITNIISTMLRMESTVNISDVILGKEKYDNKDEFEVLMSAKDFCLDKNNLEFTRTHQDRVINLLNNKKEVLVDFIQQAHKKDIFTKSEFAGIIKRLDASSKKLLLTITA